MAQLIKKQVCHKPDDLSSILSSHTADKTNFHSCLLSSTYALHTQINKCEFKKKLKNVTIEKSKQANKGSSNKSKYTGYIKGAQ